MEQELVNALQSLIQAFETNVRDCEKWVQYRNAVDTLRQAAEQGLYLTGGILPPSEPLSSPKPGTGIEYLSHQPTSK